MTRIRVFIYIAGLMCLAQMGCGSDTPTQTSPPPPAPAFFPLATGNTWTYRNEFNRTDIINSDTTVFATVLLQRVDEITGSEMHDGRSYQLMETRLTSSRRPDTLRSWKRYRQDDDGLFLFDIPIIQPPATAVVYSMARGRDLLRVAQTRHQQRLRALSVGEEPGEVTELLYPLEEGKTWGRAVFTFVIEAQEQVVVPRGVFDAYPVRIIRERQGPEDIVKRWWSPCGVIKFISHIETMAINPDPQFPETALVVTEELQELMDFVLQGETACAADSSDG